MQIYLSNTLFTWSSEAQLSIETRKPITTVLLTIALQYLVPTPPHAAQIYELQEGDGTEMD